MKGQHHSRRKKKGGRGSTFKIPAPSRLTSGRHMPKTQKPSSSSSCSGMEYVTNTNLQKGPIQLCSLSNLRQSCPALNPRSLPINEYIHPFLASACTHLYTLLMALWIYLVYFSVVLFMGWPPGAKSRPTPRAHAKMLASHNTFFPPLEFLVYCLTLLS